MQSITNYVLIKAEKTIEDRIKGGNIELFLDGTFEPEKNARIYGEVISAPQNLKDIELYREFRRGAFRYIGAEEIQLYKNHGKNVNYRCSTYEPEEDIADISIIDKMDIMPGDRAYFHFHALQGTEIEKLEDGSTIHAVMYDQIFCVVGPRGYAAWETPGVNQIIPVGGHVLIEPYFGEGLEEFDLSGIDFKGATTPLPKSIKGKVGNFGIITDIHDKPVLYTGIVRFIGAPVGNWNIDVKPGDKILYSRHSDFENVIEGRSYYVMKLWDLIAKV